MKCRLCKCTDNNACDPPCGWAEENLCTSCAFVAEQIRDWIRGAVRPSFAALKREVMEEVRPRVRKRRS